MKGLLYKDLLEAWRTSGTLLFLVALFLGVAGFSGAGMGLLFAMYPSLLSMMVPVTVMACEERDGWDAYSVALPCKRGVMVWEKYLFAGGLQVVVALLSALVYAVGLVRTGSFQLSSLLLMGAMTLALPLLYAAFSFPLLFRFGVNKGRVLFAVVTGVLFAGAAFLSTALKPKGAFAEPPVPLLAGISVLGIALFALSCPVSIALYRKRDM